MKRLRKALCVLLSVLLVLSSVSGAFAVTYRTETVNERLGKLTLMDEYDMWHYSNGTWRVGNAYSSFTWTDAEIGGAVNIGRQLQAKTKVTYKWTVPAEWMAMTGDGIKIQIGIAPASKTWRDWYDTSSFTQQYDNGTVTYTFSPYYHLSSLRTLDDYIAGLKITMPLIDISWGSNLYSIFRNSTNLGRSEGRYWDDYPTGIGIGYMHPQFIKNSTGVLKGGYTINTEQGNAETAGLSVGTNTLVNGGALGLLFKFPLIATLDLVGTRQIPVYSAAEIAEQERQKAEEEEQMRREEQRRIEEEKRRQEELIKEIRIHRVN